MVIDSHAHMTMFGGAERSEVLARAEAAGVTRILVPATGSNDIETVCGVVEKSGGACLAALGFHPHEADQLDGGWKGRLEQYCRRPGVVAVGEIGLDYHYMNSPAEDQRRAFAWQLAMARELDLPVVLHHREAWDDFLAVLDTVPGVRGVAHSFTEGRAGVEDVTRRGLYVGISGMVTFPRAENIRDAARAVPEGRLLVETDSPFLAPIPHRGRRNEPAWVRLVAEEVARERRLDVEELERQTDDAFTSLFQVPLSS